MFSGVEEFGRDWLEGSWECDERENVSRLEEKCVVDPRAHQRCSSVTESRYQLKVPVPGGRGKSSE